MMRWNERLREKRKENSLTQEDLAQMVGCSKGAISQYETGRFEPSLKTMKKLITILNTTSDDLFFYNQDDEGSKVDAKD